MCVCRLNTIYLICCISMYSKHQPHMIMYVSFSFILSNLSVCLLFCPPVPLLEQLCSALLYPDEPLKASVLYVWLKLFGTAGGLAAQSLPIVIRDRVCFLLLQTLANASSSQLIITCIGEKNICH